MVLDKLGESLRNTLSKIANAVFVDEKLVNELVKDIQRALLQADVNVKLVFELSKKIKERILKEETPPGLTKKEYLINIVYEELTHFLGAEGAKIELTKKPFIIMLVGLFGNGKCVDKNTNILLWSGQTITAEKLYLKHQSKGEMGLQDGSIIPLTDDLYVPSMNVNTLKIEKKKITYLWKLKAKNLMEVFLDNGNNFSVKTTYEHPFFILNNGAITQKRADELTNGDFVGIPAYVPSESKTMYFIEQIKNMNVDLYLPQKNISRVKEDIKAKYTTLKNAVKSLPFKRNYAKFTLSLKNGQVPVQFINGYNEERITLKHYDSIEAVQFPTRFCSELAEFAGYVIGDGYLSKGSINISNEDSEIIDRIKELSLFLFSKKIAETRDKRSEKLVCLRLNSQSLVQIFHQVFKIPIGKKGRYLESPGILQESSLDAVSLFLRAYFDCDGYFNKKERQIEIVSESKILLQQVHHLLLRFNILGILSKKEIKNKEYYRLFIQGRYAVAFGKKIGSLIKRKKDALESYSIMTIKQGDGKQDLIHVGTLLNEVRNGLGYSISQIQQEVSSYGLYEQKGCISRTQLKKLVAIYDRNKIGNFSKLIGVLENKEVASLSNELQLNQPLINALVGQFKSKGMLAEVTNSPTKLILTKKGKDYVQNMNKNSVNDKLEQLRRLAFSDISWTKVTKAVPVSNSSEYVYDLTVEDNHNFIADGVIVHNTTTAGKLAKFFQKRGSKIALIQTDTWRPAAYDQLQQLGAQLHVDVYGNKKAKQPGQIYNEYKYKFKNYDVVIVDTAGRDALNEELIDELKELNTTVHADETILVMAADLGQAAQKQAEVFKEQVHITGVIITKLDGTAKGGGALTACAVTSAPVKLIGVGEKIDALEEFKPKNFVGRLLGMGDLEALLAKAKEAITEQDAEDLGKKFLSGKFNLIDLYEQMQAMTKLGPLSKVLEMIPGMSSMQLPKELVSGQEDKLKKWKYIMDSCTEYELENPEDLDNARIERIAHGSGSSPGEVKELLKHYKQSKKMMKMFKGAGSGNMQQMMKKFKGLPGMAGLGMK